ncbi:MAG: branched-chain amino acid ABC transporter permease [Actinobacteria bacterium]|nr:branched-chain amino acid ABC transporter permease [Actinomycetota bacterium]
MGIFVQTLGFGIAAGAVISLGAVGFTVQFGISNVLNITYGAFMTLAAFLGYVLLNRGLDVWVVLVAVGVVIAIASAVFNRVFLSPLRGRGAGFVNLIIGTVAAAIILQGVIVIAAGPSAVTYGQQYGKTVSGAGLVFSLAQLIIISITVALMFGLHLLLTRTKVGRAMRATSTNRTVARACGIRTERIIDLTWLLTGFLCGAAGVALAVTTVTFDFSIGSTFLIYMIAASVLGGIGQPYGAMIGGLVVGITSQLGAAYWSPAYQDVVAFCILIAMLLIRPRGLFVAAGVNRRNLSAT